MRAQGTPLGWFVKFFCRKAHTRGRTMQARARSFSCGGDACDGGRSPSRETVASCATSPSFSLTQTPFTGSEKGLFLAPIGAVWHALAPLYSRAKKSPGFNTFFRQLAPILGADWRQELAPFGAKRCAPIGANSWFPIGKALCLLISLSTSSSILHKSKYKTRTTGD